MPGAMALPAPAGSGAMRPRTPMHPRRGTRHLLRGTIARRRHAG